MSKMNVTWSISKEVIEAVQQEAARRSKMSGTKVSYSAAADAVLREALLSPAPPMQPAQPKGSLTRPAPKPGKITEYKPIDDE